MKRNTLLLLFSLISLWATAQGRGSDIGSLLEKYGNLKYAETIEISPALLGALIGNGQTENFTKDLSLLKILTLPKNGENSGNSAEKLREESRIILSNGYSKLMDVKSDGEKLAIYLREAQPGELVMIADSETDITLMCIRGNISKELIQAVLNGEISVKNK